MQFIQGIYLGRQRKQIKQSKIMQSIKKQKQEFYFQKQQKIIKKMASSITKINQQLNRDLKDQIQPQPHAKIQKQSNQQQMNCRICLEPMTIQQIFSYCYCKGSSGYVHEKCLSQWVKKLKKFKQGRFKHYVLCDICKGEIHFYSQLNVQLLTMQEIKTQFGEGFWKRNLSCTVVSLLIFLLTMFLLIMVIYLESLKWFDDVGQDFFGIALAISVILIVLNICIYIAHLIFKVEVIPQKIRRYKFSADQGQTKQFQHKQHKQKSVNNQSQQTRHKIQIIKVQQFTASSNNINK